MTLARFAFWAAILTSNAVVAADQIPWMNDLATAQRMAASRNQLIMVHFTADWCGPCQRLEKGVFAEPSFAYGVTQNFVPVKINVSQNPALAQQFNVTEWPTDVLLSANGSELHRMVSPQNAQEYLHTLRQVAWGHRQGNNAFASQTTPHTIEPPKSSITSGVAKFLKGKFSRDDKQPENPFAALAQSPSQLRPANQPNPVYAPRSSVAPAIANGAAPVMRQAPNYQQTPSPQQYAAPSFAQQTGMQPTANFPAAAQVGAPMQTRNQTAMASPPQTVGQHGMMQASGTLPTSGSYTQPVAPATAGYAQPTQIQQAAQQMAAPTQPAPVVNAAPIESSPAEPMTVVNNFVSQPHAGNTSVPMPMTPQPQPAQTPTRQSQPNPASAPTDQQLSAAPNLQTSAGASQPAATTPEAPPEMGLDGFCPISLLRGNQWLEGDQRWGAKHRGKVYLFNNAAAQQTFLSDPDRYSPLLSGFDPVVYQNTGNFVPGKREHGIRYQEHIILFSSEASVEQFAQDPGSYLSVADQAVRAVDTQMR